VDAGANTLTVDSDEISGESFIITSTGTTAGDLLVITVNQATADLSGLVINDSAITTTINANTFTAVLGTTVTGSAAAETILVAGGKASTASGGSGNDTLTGGAEGDVLSGDAGNDTLNGAGGADTLFGGAGNDTINGDGGADRVTGGAGDDTFVITAGESTEAAMDVILDYTADVAANDNDTLDIFSTADADTLAVGADIAATDDVRVHAADASGVAVAGEIEAVVVDGILTLVGTAASSIDTLAEWIDAATLVLESYDVAAGVAEEVVAFKEHALAFEFAGDTYVVTGIDAADGAAGDVTLSDVVMLDGLTGITDLATAAAANTVLIA
jgi:hypothetical protein